MQQEAILVRNAYKRYGKEKDLVLDDLNMTVPRGCIYGLLGASGCGKTTLLSCIVGVRKLDQGEIWVLGGRPGDKNSGVPGPRVGYMPQETSLVGEFSVIGALYYFGRINGLEDKEIQERYAFFSKLLQLPPKGQFVKNLSGGQQRRVSLAASLIHKPELLILDEPTVGLDPVLRESIWDFLQKLAKEEKTAIVITTHYIEETKFANRIGLLRRGKLLAETSPSKLLSRFGCESLEEAFLILSQRQEESRDEESREVTNVDNVLAIADHDGDPPCTTSTLQSSEDFSSTDSTIVSEDEIVDRPEEKRKIPAQRLSTFGKIFKALMIKNLLQIIRNPGSAMFAFVFPIIQTTAFFYSVGGDPKGVVMAIINDEAGHCDYGQNLGKVIYKPDEKICDYVDISCRFLHGFDESIMSKEYFNTIADARFAVKSGKAVGTMYFARNFSQALQKRRDTPALELGSLEEADIVASEIEVALDMGDRQIGLFLQKNLLERFFEIHSDIVSTCNISHKYALSPIHLEEPVYGKLDQTYSDFMAPVFILTNTFFLAVGVAASIVIVDRAEGVWDRSLVQGVTTPMILLSHILTNLLIIIIQITVILVISFVYFQFTCRGSFPTAVALTLLNGLCGMCFGFLVSVLCKSHTVANYVVTGSFYPIMLLCGFIWPVEGMPQFLGYISYVMPITLPGLALRGIMDKGYSIDDADVYIGFFVTTIWICIFITLSLLGLRKKT